MIAHASDLFEGKVLEMFRTHRNDTRLPPTGNMTLTLKPATYFHSASAGHSLTAFSFPDPVDTVKVSCLTNFLCAIGLGLGIFDELLTIKLFPR